MRKVILFFLFFALMASSVWADPSLSASNETDKKQLSNIIDKVKYYSELTRGKDHKKNMALIEKGLKIDFKNKTLLYYKAVSYISIGRYKPALEAADYALSFYPNDSKLLSLKQKVTLVVEELNKKITSYEADLKNNPLDVRIRLSLVDAYEEIGNYKSAAALLKQGLLLQPNNVDLLYAQAVFYMDLEQFKSARKNVKKILALDPINIEANRLHFLLMRYPDKNMEYASTEAGKAFVKSSVPQEKKQKKRLSKVDELIKAKSHKAALEEINFRLAKSPTDQNLLYQKALIYFEMERYRDAQMALDDLFDLYPDNAKGLALVSLLKKADPHHLRGLNSLEISTYPTYVSDLRSWWTYNTVSYGRITSAGPIYLQVNNATRFGVAGYQYQASFYPKISRFAYLYLSYAYSSSDSGKDLWPYDRGEAEVYFQLPWEMEFSVGGKYFNILDNTYFWVNTVSISKFAGNYWFRLRPYFYYPKAGANAIYFQADFRRYFGNPETWLGVSFYTGNTPDLADLTSVGFFIISSTGFLLQAQFPLKYGLFMRLGVGYIDEVFPTGLNRKKTTLGMAIKYRF